MLQSPSALRTSRRRQHERTLRGEAILGAAERVFAEAGFHDASVERIAAEAGFATGTIYLYFANKEALYRAVFEEKLRQKIEFIEKRVACEADPLRAMRAAVQAQLEFYDRHRAFFDLVLQQPPLPPDRREADNIWKFHRRHSEILEKLIVRGQHAGVFRELDTRLLAGLIIAVSMHVLRDRALQRSAGASAGHVDLVLDVLLHGVARSRSARK